jgi:hypothetical protein
VLIRRRNPGGVHLLAAHTAAELRPAAPVPGAGASVLPWIVAIVILAVVFAGGVYLTSRR